MLQRFISSSLPRASVLGSQYPMANYHVSQNLFAMENEEFKEAMEECEGLPIQHFFSVKESANIPKNFMFTSKTWKTPVKRFFWVPLLAFLPSGSCTLICLGGGYWIARLIPHPTVQKFVNSIKQIVPRYCSSVSLKDPNPKDGEQKEYKMEFFHKNSCLKFSKEDIANVEVVTRRTLLGNESKVVKLTIKMKQMKENDLETVDFFIGAENDWEAELIAKLFEE